MTVLLDSRTPTLHRPERLGPDDVSACMDLLDARGAWLHDVRGITDQWPRSMRGAAGGPGGRRTYDRTAELQRAADAWTLWGIREDSPDDRPGRVVACAIVDTHADPDYVDHYPATALDPDTGEAFAEPRTFYVHRMASAVDRAGLGLGSELLRQAARVARERGGVLLRLECSRHNDALRDYYRDRGFVQVADVAVPGRFSGALFQRVIDWERLRFSLSTRGRIEWGLPI